MSGTDIAIVGMACRFPGSANSPEEFWDLLDTGRDAVREVPPERWSVPGLYSPDRDLPGRISTRWAGCVDDIDLFDAGFFGISPHEAAQTDPQQRMLLEVAHEALERAGIPVGGPELARGGVFTGVSGSDYGRLLGRDLNPLDAYYSTGQAASITSGRLSYQFDMRGPSVATDTACSSSLTAVHLAVRALRAGECDLALVGGVNLVLAPDLWVSFSKFGMMSPRGRCHAFGAEADGYVRSDGCGVLVLRPLADAERAGQEILAVIRGSAANSDGRSNGLTAPNGSAQEAVIRQALADAGTSPDEIGYVEAHGSGTPLGDPIEFGALARTYGAARHAAGHRCHVGSVKSNIGHAEAAAGIAGLIKLVLCLRHGRIPATLHAEPPNPRLPRAEGLAVATEPRPWPGPRVGAVSSFGFGGSNAHVVVAAAPDRPETVTPPGEDGALLLPLSARTPEALHALAGRYARWLARGPVDLTAACAGAALRRTHHEVRAAFAAAGQEGLRAELEAYAARPPEPARTTRWRDTVMVFSGQGREFPGMGRRLLADPVFEEHALACDAAFRDVLGASVLDLLREDTGGDAGGDAGKDRLRRTDLAQAVLFTLQTGLARVWRAFGVVPSAVLGHSAGEAAAAHTAGILDLDEAVRLVAARGTAMQAASGLGRMAAVAASAASVEGMLPDGVVVAADNGPASVVVSGPEPELRACLAVLSAEGVECRLLDGEFAFHHPVMGAAADRLAKELEGLRLRPGLVPFFSSVTGGLLHHAQADAGHWARGLTGRVRFREAVETLARAGLDSFLELGPRPTHGPGVITSAAAAGASAQTVHGFSPDGPAGMRSLLGELYARGAAIDWTALYTPRRLPPGMPLYPWQHARFWALPEPALPEAPSSPSPERGTTVSAAPSPEPSPIGQIIKTELAGLLGSDPGGIGELTRFVELGADSLTMMRLVTAVNRRFSTDLRAPDLFERYPTVAALAGRVRELAGEAPAEPGMPPAAGPVTAVAGPGTAVAGPGTAVAGPGTAVTAGGPAAAPDGPLAGIIQAQLEIMREQLRALNGGPAPAAPAVPESPVRQAVPESAGAPASPPLTADQRRYVGELAERLERRSPTSKRLAARHRRHLAESRPWANFRPEVKELIFPLVTERGEGSRIWDVDGAEYTDYCLGFGVHLFGHNPDFVVDAVQAQVRRLHSIGTQVELAYRVAERLCRITGYERVTFCTTGSEAVMGALRLARLATGRDRVVYFARSYHGTTDSVLGRPTGGLGEAGPIAPGVSARAVEDAIVLPYGDPAALDHIREHADRIAAVLVEPVQSRNPAEQPGEFLADLRRLTRRHGIVLVFDEMITGFRIGLRGAQGYFGIRPDMTTYGKIIGGGLPLSVIAGSAELLAGMDGGAWTYGDASAPASPTTLFGGTFQKHPLSLAAADAVLTHLEERGEDLYADLNARAERTTSALGEILRSAGLPYTVASFGSMWRFQYRGMANLYQPLQLEMLYYSLLAEGLHVWEGRTFFLSTAHDDGDVDRLLKAVETSVRRLREVGFAEPAPSAPGEPAPALPATAQQRDLRRLCRRLGPGSTAYNEAVVVELDGPLDPAALRRALDVMRRRHTALGSTFDESGEWMRAQPYGPVELPVIDLAGETADGYDAAIGAWVNAPYDLSGGPLFRPTLVRRGEDRHALVLAAHHLVLDGQSYAVLIPQIAEAYARIVAGQEVPVRVPEWPRSLPREADAGLVAYWRDRLSGYDIPAAPDGEAPDGPGHDRLRNAGEPGVRTTLGLAPGMWHLLRERATARGCTPFMLAFCAFAYVLHEAVGRDDLLIGASTDRRADLPDDALDRVGHFADVIPVRSRREPGEEFAFYLDRTRDHLVHDLSHGRLPLAEIAELAGTSPENLVTVVFDVNPPLEVGEWPGLSARIAMAPLGEAKHDLFFDVIPTGDGAMLDVTYRAPFDAPAVERICARWRDLLDSLS
ncbi:aminotransferase class III-fold pyridoxal phosphate-dependent enzyme [Streptosporangium sp. NPDC000396]|uniref:aminotransferase class III-fold pyridoxal phosphate-dependent enzyme n=1 Tax=Streptosporangium sp. NPDC000396 TaxID=3366185 RepID=UPI0036850511